MITKGKLTAAAVLAAIGGTALCSCTADSDLIHITPYVQDQAQQGVTTASVADNVTTTAAMDIMTTTTEESTTTTTTTTTSPVLRGNIYDCHKTLITYSTRTEDGGEERHFTDGYKYSFGNIISQYSAGIDTELEETLRTVNPSAVDGDEKVGQSIQLTIDGEMQNALYNYMESMGMVGSVVVLRTDGSLMAEVSYPSYDPMLYAADSTYVDTLSYNALANKAFQNNPPGSCFKIMSEVVADMNGITCLYDEGTWEVDGATIVNWDHDTGWYPVEERTLYSAFVNSSNIFFAKAFDQIGADKAISDLESVFHFLSPIYCDFGPMENDFEIFSNDDLRRSAFGQSNVRTCPIYLAALGREAVFGDMVKPFVVHSIVDTNDPNSEVFPGTAPYDWIASIPVDYRQDLLDGMSGVGGNLGMYVPENYRFYAKTGTAETGGEDILYITGVLQNVNDGSFNEAVWSDYSEYNGSYVIVMQLQNPNAFEFNFASESVALYQGLINTVVG